MFIFSILNKTMNCIKLRYLWKKTNFFSIRCKNHSGKLKICQNQGLFWSEKLWGEAASLKQTQHHHLKLDLTETQPLHAVGRASFGFLSGLFDVTNFMLYFRIQNKMVASWLFDEVLFISKWGGYCEDVLRVAEVKHTKTTALVSNLRNTAITSLWPTWKPNRRVHPSLLLTRQV